MAIQTIRDGTTAIIAVNGRLDAVTADQYQQTAKAQIQSGATRIVVDFEELAYISSAGLSQLVITSRLMKQQGGEFRLANLRGHVRSVFEMCSMGELLHVHDSVAEALTATENS